MNYPYYLILGDHTWVEGYTSAIAFTWRTQDKLLPFHPVFHRLNLVKLEIQVPLPVEPSCMPCGEILADALLHLPLLVHFPPGARDVVKFTFNSGFRESSRKATSNISPRLPCIFVPHWTWLTLVSSGYILNNLIFTWNVKRKIRNLYKLKSQE